MESSPKILVTTWGRPKERAEFAAEFIDTCPCCEVANGAGNVAEAGTVWFLEIETSDVATMRRFFDNADSTRLIRRVERVTDGWPAGFLCVTVTEEQAAEEMRAEGWTN